MDYSNHTQVLLFQPLIGTEEEPSSLPSSLLSSSLVTKEQQQSSSSSSSPIQPPQQHHDIWISALLFSLMYFHFGLIFYSDRNHIIHGISWLTINVSITLFIIATLLYRHALHDVKRMIPILRMNFDRTSNNSNSTSTSSSGSSSDLVVLVPELIIIISMALVFFHHIIAAFLLLALGKLYMAFTVILINSYHLWFLATEDNDTDNAVDGDNDEDREHDKDSIV